MIEQCLADDDTVAFKIFIGFVVRKVVELIEIGINMYRVSLCDFVPAPNGLLVWEGEFAQSHEREKASEEHTDEQEVIVLGRSRVVCNYAS